MVVRVTVGFSTVMTLVFHFLYHFLIFCFILLLFLAHLFSIWSLKIVLCYRAFRWFLRGLKLFYFDVDVLLLVIFISIIVSGCFFC